MIYYPQTAEENGNPLQYSCLGNPMFRGAGQATVCGVTESVMTAQLSAHVPPNFPTRQTSLTLYSLLK